MGPQQQVCPEKTVECVFVLPPGKAQHLGPKCLHKQSVDISVCDTHPCFLAAGLWIISMCVFAVLLLKLVAQGLATPEMSVLLHKQKYKSNLFQHRCGVFAAFSQGHYLTLRCLITAKISQFNTRVPGCYQNVTWHFRRNHLLATWL